MERERVTVGASVAVFLLALAGYVAFLAVLFPGLPEWMATHFDAAGKPDGWMPRGRFLWFGLLFGIGVPLFIVGLSYAVRLFPSSMLNVPNAEYWRRPSNYPRACAHILRWSLWFSTVLLIWMGVIHWQIISVNRMEVPRLQGALTAMGLLLATSAILFMVLIRLFRKPAEDPDVTG